MTRASPRTPREVERRFPVRVRLAVPPDGFGRQLAIMRAWLDQTCGAAGWTMAPSGLAGVVNDAIAFNFADGRLARAFVTRFCCGYRIGAGGLAPLAAMSPIGAVTVRSDGMDSS